MVGLLKRETTWVGDEPQGKYPTPIYISCKSFSIKFNVLEILRSYLWITVVNYAIMDVDKKHIFN